MDDTEKHTRKRRRYIDISINKNGKNDLGKRETI
jgi:hypothetical protein